MATTDTKTPNTAKKHGMDESKQMTFSRSLDRVRNSGDDIAHRLKRINPEAAAEIRTWLQGADAIIKKHPFLAFNLEAYETFKDTRDAARQTRKKNS